MIKTEFDFTLPNGFIDDAGRVHKQGRMRLALAIDEVEALNDSRVQNNEAYLPIILLARVITTLGDLPAVTPQITARLFAADLAYLEDIYERINTVSPVVVGTTCPACGHTYALEVAPLA